MSYAGPVTAVVFPAEQLEKIAAVLHRPAAMLTRTSRGYLASLIGLSYLNHVDPVQAVEWAKTAAQQFDDPLPLYVAHLADALWRSRNTQVKSRLRLQDQFPELTELFRYFENPENREFLEQARLRFETDITSQTLPWFLLDQYLLILDQSDDKEFKLITQIMKQKIAINPASHNYWSFLAEIYEEAENTPEMVAALEGTVSASPVDFDAKLRLAYGYVVLEQDEQAKAILETIDPGKVWYDADYTFCQGAVAEWEGKEKDALQLYRNAIEMRRYTPLYHLKYGKLLLKHEKQDEARKALKWAARIDGGDEIRTEAEQLLMNMKPATL